MFPKLSSKSKAMLYILLSLKTNRLIETNYSFVGPMFMSLVKPHNLTASYRCNFLNKIVTFKCAFTDSLKQKRTVYKLKQTNRIKEQ